VTTVFEIDEALKAMGQRLRIARQRRKLSQAELGQRMAVTRQTVDRLESGDPGVRLQTLCSALRALDLPLDPLEDIADPRKDHVGLSAELGRLGGKPERKETDPRDEYDFGKR
jgi:transcriptional regulator with XRE-family HTH domain